MESRPDPAPRARLSPALDRDAYCSAEVWEHERDLLFARQWSVVGRVSDIGGPGSMRRFDLAGESIVVVNDPGVANASASDAGGLRAFFNVCRHRGAELLVADTPVHCAGGVIQCPYHHWAYGLDGALRRTPHLRAEERPDQQPYDDLSLKRVEIDTWGGFVFVCLDATNVALAAQLGGVVERTRRYPLASLERGAQIVYEVDANWKVIAENYNECYHCGPVHPELCDLVPAFRERGGGELNWDDGIPHRDGAWTFTASGTSDREPFADLDSAERVRHKGKLIYPNLLLSLSADHVVALMLLPHGPNLTTVVCDVLFAPDEIARPTFDPSDAVDFWDAVNRQDWAICESVQRGMQSRGFRHGFFAPMEDESLDIRRWYERVMGTV